MAASKEGLNSAFAAMLGGLPDPAINEEKKNVAKPKQEKNAPKKTEKKTEDKPVEQKKTEEPVIIDTELLQKKSKAELRNKRKQFMLTESMCDKLKKYSEEYEISENEIICQLINRLP